MDIEILRKRSRLQTQGRDEGSKGRCPLLSFVLGVCSLWSKVASPVCCHLTCLCSVYLFLPLSVPPPPSPAPLSLPWQKGEKRVFLHS